MVPRKPDTDQAMVYNNALIELQKSLKAISFYPDRHPLREEILRKAYQVISGLASNGGFSLIVRRNGISFADPDIPADKSPLSISLAKELFTREIQQLTLLPDLSFGEFVDFIALVAQEPHSIINRGGLAEILNEKGIRSVIANEIDITAVYTRKSAGAPSEETTAEGEGPRRGDDGFAEDFDLPEMESEDHLSDLSMEDLLLLMDREQADDRYRLMAMLLPAKGDLLKAGGEHDRLFLVLSRLLKQISDERKSPAKQQCALLAFQRLALGAMIEHLLDHLESEDFRHNEIVFTILNLLGGDIVDAVMRRITARDDHPGMKALNTALARIGPPAIPALVRLLRDQDWQMVRRGAAILGDMGNREAVGDLKLCVHHPENRVRMEAIRALARIGGREATALLIDLLDDKNEGLKKQAIIWLGITRNEKALQNLLQIAMRLDFTGRNHSLKKEAIVALGRIGDRQALDPLRNLVKKRNLISSERSEELKITAIEAIAQLDGESSREFLERMETRGGRVGRACSATLKSMERLARAEGSVGVAGAGDTAGSGYR